MAHRRKGDASPMDSMKIAQDDSIVDAAAMEGVLHPVQALFTSAEGSVTICNGSRQPSLRINTLVAGNNLGNPTPIYSPAVFDLSGCSATDMSTSNGSCGDFSSLTPTHTPHRAFRPALHGLHGQGGAISLATSLSSGAPVTTQSQADNHYVMVFLRSAMDASQHLFETTRELCYTVSKGSFRYESIEEGVKLCVQEAHSPHVVHKRLGLVLFAASVLRAVPYDCILFDGPDRLWLGLLDFVDQSVDYLVEVGVCRDLAGQLIDKWCRACNDSQPLPSSKTIISGRSTAEMANPDNHPIAVCRTFFGVLRSLGEFVAGGDIVQSPLRSFASPDPQRSIVEPLLRYWNDETLYETLRARIMHVACHSNARSEGALGWHLLNEATGLPLPTQDLSRFYMQVAELCRAERYLSTAVELGKEALHQLAGSMHLVVDHLTFTGPPPTPLSDSRVVCCHSGCGKVFTGEFAVGNRRKHSQSAHETDPNDRPQCLKCKKRFARRDILQKHQTVTKCARRP